MSPRPTGQDLEAVLRRAVPWVALLTVLLWAPLVSDARHSWDDADPEVLNNAWRLARGEPLYHGIESPPWVVSPYTPIYTGVVAALLRHTGLSYRPARLVSILASLGVAAILAAWAGRFRGSAREGLWAACLLLLAPAVLYNAARPHPQMLAVLLSLSAFLAFGSRRPLVADGLSPLLAALGVYTKQTQIFLPLCLLAWLALHDRRRLWRYAGVLALLGLAPVPWLQAASHGAFLECVVSLGVLSYHVGQIVPVLLHHAGPLAVFLGLGVARAWRRFRGREAQPLDYYFAGLGAATLLSLGRVGAHGQYVTELLVVTVLYLLRTGGLRLPKGREPLMAAQLGLLMAYALAFVLLEEGPWDRASLRAAPRVRALLARAPGPVISQQGSFPLFTRGEIHIQLFHFTDLALHGRWDQGPLLREVAEERVAWVVTESPLEEPLRGGDDLERFTPELWRALQAHYVREAQLPPYYVYRPRQGG